MIELRVSILVNGQRLQVDAWAEVDDGRLAAAMRRGTQPYSSLVWLQVPEIRVFTFEGQPVRLRDHLELASTDVVLRLKSLECTLMSPPPG